MGDLGEAFDDTDDLAGTDGLGVLGGMDVSAAGLRNQFSTNEANRKARAELREKNYYAPRRALYEKYGKDLEARRAGPTSAERLYELGAAFFAPKNSPGFGGTIANVAPVLAAQRKAMREAEAAKSAMLTKYNIDVGEQAGDQLKQEQETQTLADKERLAVMSRIYSAENTPKMYQVLDEATGNLVYRLLSPADMRRQAAGAVPAGAVPAGVARPKTQAEYDLLPKGTRYVAQNGTIQEKP